MNSGRGISETGYNHQAGWDPIPDDVRPTACWMEHTVQVWRRHPTDGHLVLTERSKDLAAYDRMEEK